MGGGGLSPRGELRLVLLLLVGIAAAAYASYVAHGGFHSDDWSNLAKARQNGYLGAVGLELDIAPNRPLLAALLVLPHAVFGGDPLPHLLLAVVLAVLMSACFFSLLREMRVPTPAAAAVAGLVLLFPWSDASRLSPAGSINQVAVILYLVGAIVAVRGLRSNGRRAVLIQLSASALFAMSVLTYEATGPLALATGVLYFAFTARRRALTAWAMNIVTVGAALAFSAARNPKFIGSGHSLLVNAEDMARGAAVLTAHAVFPIVGDHTWVVVTVLVVIAVAALLALFGKDRLFSAELRRPMVTLGAAAVAIGLGYVMFVPAAYWTPQKPGLENRVNLVAALPITLFVYMFVTVLVLLVVPRARSRSGMRTGLVSLIAIAIALDYGVRLHNDEHTWTRSYTAERGVLATLHQVLPRPGAGTTIFTFDVPAQVAPRMPVFYDTWDLHDAVEVIYRDASLSAYPVFTGARFSCSGSGVTPLLPTPSSFGQLFPQANGQQVPLPYGRVVFVDILDRRVHRISSQRDCTQAAGRFRPGPIESPRLLRLIEGRAGSSKLPL